MAERQAEPPGEQDSPRKLWRLVRKPMVWFPLVAIIIIGIWAAQIWGADPVGRTRGLAEWAEPFAPFSTAVVAAVAGVIAWVSHRHRRISDNRAEWWRRVQYAIDLVRIETDKIGRRTGQALLGRLLHDKSTTQRDAAMLEQVVNALVTEVLEDEADRPGWMNRLRAKMSLRRRVRRQIDESLQEDGIEVE